MVYLGAFHRDPLRAVDWAGVDPVDEVLSADGCRLNLKGSTRGVIPIPTGDDDELQGLLGTFSASLHPLDSAHSPGRGAQTCRCASGPCSCSLRLQDHRQARRDDFGGQAGPIGLT